MAGLCRTKPEISTPLENLNLFFGVEKGDGADVEMIGTELEEDVGDTGDCDVTLIVVRPEAWRDKEGATASAGCDASSSRARRRAERKCAGETDAAF